MSTYKGRYDKLPVGTLETAKGDTVVYHKRRFLPEATTLPLLVEVVVTEGDRLDLMATRTLGDGEAYWRICDANNAMHPDELTDEIGARLRVPLPQVEG